jgi:transcription termination factor NusB
MKPARAHEDAVVRVRRELEQPGSVPRRILRKAIAELEARLARMPAGAALSEHVEILKRRLRGDGGSARRAATFL